MAVEINGERIEDPVYLHYEMEILEESENCTVIRMPVTEKNRNYSGHLHGAVYYALADIVSGHHVHLDGRAHVTQSGGLNLMKAVSGGFVYAKGTFLHKGRKTSVIRVEIYDEENHLLAEGNYSYYCLSETESSEK